MADRDILIDPEEEARLAAEEELDRKKEMNRTQPMPCKFGNKKVQKQSDTLKYEPMDFDDDDEDGDPSTKPHIGGLNQGYQNQKNVQGSNQLQLKNN